MIAKSEYHRSCPSCKNVLYYSSKKGLKVANKLNQVCKRCSNLGENNPNYGKPCPEYVREIARITHTGRVDSEETRNKKRNRFLGERNPMFGLTGSLCPNFGSHCSEEHKQKLHELRWAVPISQEHREHISEGLIGRIQSPETKRKMRLAKIRHIIENNGSIAPRYNKRACEYFNILEKEMGWNGLYASKNGEFFVQHLGYFVDYYEPTRNIIVEYDEKKHYNIDNSLKKRDVERMREIMEYLRCDFYRYNERTKKLEKYV
jgi:hypothetical protein